MAAAKDSENDRHVFELGAEEEVRLEIPLDKEAQVVVEEGFCEIFGVELAAARPLTIRGGQNVAVFTWLGARVSVSGSGADGVYKAGGTPMNSYVACHGVLQAFRERARGRGGAGPVCVVVGGREVGKSSLVAMLSAWCVKQNGAAVMVDLDPAMGRVVGSVGVGVGTHVDVEEGGVLWERECRFFVGHADPRENLDVLKALAGAVKESMDKLVEKQPELRYLGCIVDTPGWLDAKEGGLELLLASIKAINADVVLVLGAERLYAALSNNLAGTSVESVNLAKSGGVVQQSDSARRKLQMRKLRHYFYGPPHAPLNPFRTVVNFNAVQLYQIGGGGTVATDSMLPIGLKSTLNPLTVKPVTIHSGLKHSVLAVSQASTEKDVLLAPVYGFVHVVNVDETKRQMELLAPSPGNLPSPVLVVGSIKHLE